MAAEPVIPNDLPSKARAILREYGGPPVIAEMADEIERLRSEVERLRYAARGIGMFDTREGKANVRDGNT